jgi:hypothetical protein
MAATGTLDCSQTWLRQGRVNSHTRLFPFLGCKDRGFFGDMQENGGKNAKDCLFCYLSRGYVGVENGHRTMDFLDNLIIWNDKRLNNLFTLTIIE